MSKELIVMYKEPSQTPILTKMTFEKIMEVLGRDFLRKNYMEFTILYKKNNKNLLPNFWIDLRPAFIGETIRGPIIIANETEDKRIVSLRRNQIGKLVDIIVSKSFKIRNLFRRKKKDPSKEIRIDISNPIKALSKEYANDIQDREIGETSSNHNANRKTKFNLNRIYKDIAEQSIQINSNKIKEPNENNTNINILDELASNLILKMKNNETEDDNNEQ